jgi:glycosyltransferase involved in cell wall biosynthesis
VRVSVILSTYEQPEWLRKTLWGYARQSHQDLQIVVADDGSGPATALVLEEAAARSPDLGLRHVWHPDLGFRKTVILNRAVLASTGEYLIFSDGDCIPRRDFVATHVRLAEPGRFLSGGAVRLPRALSEAITEADVATGRAFDSGWLRARGFDPGRHRLRLLPGRAWPAVLDAVSPTGATWNGNNASTWRRTVLRVNGFENELAYGGEDREFGQRLENLGVVPRRVRHRAVAVHLDHGRPYRDEAVMRRNNLLRAEVRRSGVVRARSGIAELEPETGAFVRPATARGQA